MDPQALLQKHNPVLIMLPEDTARARPGALFPGVKGRGDYHPCSAELFLSLVIWRDHPKPWLRLPMDLPFIKNLPRFREPAIGLDVLKRLVGQSVAGSTRVWELDLEGVRSQSARRAWSTYARIRARPDLAPYLGPTVYGRVAPGDPGPVLQYWYLYIYNDAPNKHEGDWEMVSIQLDAEERPSGAGYSGHAGGFRRDWRDVEKDASDAARPLVYVARGSHAAYFAHRREGHRTNSLPSPKNLTPPLQLVADALIGLLRRVWPFRDSTPAPPTDTSERATKRGEPVDNARVVLLPELAEGAPPPEELWWMRLDGKWGSCHSRGFGVIGPDPPWRHDTWHDPSGWIRGLGAG